MPDRPFAHLHCHTHYSLLDGFNRIPELVKQTKALGMSACAITDHGNLYGAIEFYAKCRDAGVNPVIGYEAYVAPGDRREKKPHPSGEKYYHLTLLAKNNTGFKNLIKLSSLAFLEGFYYAPRIDRGLLAAHSEGLICLSGCLAGELNQSILRGQGKQAEELVQWYVKVFGDDFYLEIQNNGLDLQDQCTGEVVRLSDKVGVPLVATADAHYLCSEDATAHDVLFCINTGKKHDPRRKQYPEGRLPNPYYVRSPEDMYRLFPDYADAVARSQEIANKVDIQLDFKKRHFPVFSTPGGKTADEYLRELCEAGVRERYGPEPRQEVWDRLTHELGVISRMGYSAYFLIVWDFVRYARENGIPSTARGSGCGAVVAYALYLSHVCPLEYDLLFERFLDPNRTEPPDIDIDFCQDRRELVIQYVKEKYGHDSVAQIGTFGTLAAKAALKDVGRVLDVPLERVNAMCKLVPMKGAIAMDLKDAMEVPDFRREYDTDPATRVWVDIARKLEGTNRNVGTHAAGVVIAAGPITDYVPVQRVARKTDGEEGGKGEAVVTTQWEMGIIEKVGMLKMDFLGLRNLTVLDHAVKLIAKTRGQTVDPAKFPLDDQATYALLQRGDAKGVFQLESEGIRELLKRMKPDNIRDLIAVLALYRPGPLGGGMVDSYVNRKHGKETWDYPHPVLKEILDETYGVMCIHEDALVAMADGTEKPIKQVRRSDRVHSLDPDTRRIEAKECHGCGPTRRGAGVRVTLENGYSVVLTPDHEVRTWAGWKEAQHLDPATDLVAVGARTPPDGAGPAALAPWLGADEDVAYLFGYLTGDGCLTGSGVTVATGTEANHRRLVGWLADRLPGLRRNEYVHTRSWYVTLSHPDLLGDPTRGNRKTRFHHLLEQHDLKSKAAAKRVPAAVFRAPAPVRAAFLAGLIDSDGCLATTDKGRGVAFITTVSDGLRQDLRRLFQLDGIPLKLYPTRVQIWGVARLRDVVAPHLVLKSFPPDCPTGRTVGWVPREEILAAVPAGESLRGFCSRTGIERRGLGHVSPFVKSSTAAKAGIDLGDVRFFRVVSVAPVADQQFYGMSVEDHHNLIANGIVVKNCYQEQIMRILNRLGGIDLSAAYACIKAISKKKQDIIDARRAEFVAGAQERGVAKEVAEEIFALIDKFGSYGFNKSHTAAYAQIGYQTAYLKTHYTAEYMAALLSSEIDDGNKRDVMVDHIADARRLGVDVLPPDVNAGQPDFDVVRGQITFGLTAIKGLGRGAAEEIVRARAAGGRFKDLFDFCERVDQRVVTRAAVERMIKAGAMDVFGRRAALTLALDKAFESAAQRAADRKRGQRNFFDLLDGADGDGPAADPAGGGGGLPEVPEWPELERLKFEKEALDFYISSHPLAQFDDQLRRFRTHDAADAARGKHGTELRLGGMVTNLAVRTSKTGKRFALFRLEDFTGQVKCVLWSEEYQRFKDLIADDAIHLFEGLLEWGERAEPDVIVKRVLTVDDARKELTRGLLLRMAYAEDDETLRKLEGVGKILQRYRGPCPVYLSVRDPGGRMAQFKLGNEYWVNPSNVKVDELELVLGPGAVVFTR